MLAVECVDLKTYHGVIKVRDNVISLKRHIRCTFSENGSAFWGTFPEFTCFVLYKGIETKLISSETSVPSSVPFTVNTKDTTFTLTKTSEHDLCDYTLTRTEYLKLFILETSRGHSSATVTNLSPENLDLFINVNSKFVYVEKHTLTYT